MRTLLIFLLTLCALSYGFSQEVIATSGNYFATDKGSISWTLGEVVIASHANNNFVLLQGFQQPWSPDEVSIKPLMVNEINVFPNPVRDYTIIQTKQFSGLHYMLFNFEGKAIQENVLQSDRTVIDFSMLAPSLYLLKIVKGDGELKTFKILKK